MIGAEVVAMHWIVVERDWLNRKHAQGFRLAAYPPFVPGYAAG
jgi:hypothetical protein